MSRVICLACTFPKVVPTPAPSLRHVEARSCTFPLDCFSPVSPQNYRHQSLPFSSHPWQSLQATRAQLRSIPISTVWVGQAIDTSWSHSTNGTTSICQIKGDDAALWGCAVHRHPSLGEGSLPTATGPSTLVRQSFIANGSLITSSTIFDQSGLNSRMASEKQQKRSQ